MATQHYPKPDSTEISDDNWSSTPISIRKLVVELLEARDDWDGTPLAIREFIISKLDSNQKQGTKHKNYDPKWPTWVMALVNLAIAVGLSFLLSNKIVFQCIKPRQVSELSVVFILLVILHLVWRAIHIPAPSNIEETIEIGRFKIRASTAIAFLNEIHPWRLSSRSLVLLLVFFLIVGSFLNLTPYSPFYQEGVLLAIPSFEVQRLNSSAPEQLPPGGILTINEGEKVFIKLVLLGETQISCTWLTTTSNANNGQGCSILLDVPPLVRRDILTVFIQPVCGTRKETLSLNIVVQP